MAGRPSKWRFAVDRGGTFTDVVGIDPEGRYHTLKLLSSSTEYDDASIEGIRRILGVRSGEGLPEEEIGAIRFGTTVATNALLERKGGRVVLFITAGFSDLLEIGYQDRPEIFSLCIEKPSVLYSAVIEVEERIDVNGNVVEPLNRQRLEEAIERAGIKDMDSAAVVLMHAWKNPGHEVLCEDILRERGFRNIFLSHRTVNLIKIVSRGQSTLVDAYLSTVMARYLDGIRDAVGDIPVHFMQSSGNLCGPHMFRGREAILSGPAGGAIAVGEIAGSMGLKGAVGFDMGGTSTDVTRYEGGLERLYERVIEGIDLQTEMININTVAAGGGSILWFDGRKMRVGPESAGAWPGPACYGFGGPLTITDANLITGRTGPDDFPRTFGPDRRSPIDMAVVREQFDILTGEINRSMSDGMTPEQAALGFLRIANEKMAMAIKEISVSKGYDVRDYALVCFGGAGGQHACEVASLLDMDTVIFHPLGGVLSAYGIGLASPAVKREKTVLLEYTPDSHRIIGEMFDAMRDEMILHEEEGGGREARKEVDIRPLGADTYLTVAFTGYEDTVEAFRRKYRRVFGFSPDDVPLEAVNIRIEVSAREDYFSRYHEDRQGQQASVEPGCWRNVFYEDGWSRVPVHRRERLAPGHALKGPALVVDRYSTLVIDPGFEAAMAENGVVVVKRVGGKRRTAPEGHDRADPVLLEVFNSLFMNISTEMGYTLRNTAHSVNIKERMDFSCAVFDSRGDLVANAPHIPVHLGSMADTVKAVIETRGKDMRPGDIYLTNNPYRGGSHLPDVTVVCPVFSDRGEIIFFTAARGHHADIGGSVPGSLPPFAGHIEDEGVVIDGLLLVREGEFREDALLEIFRSHRYPVRNETERIADLRAQIAACYRGMHELNRVIEWYGLETVRKYMGFIQDNAEYAVKTALAGFLGGDDLFESTFEDRLDDGTPLRVNVRIRAGENPPDTVKAVFDFTGTGGQHDRDNLNAPLSVTRSAVLYVLRAITGTDIPLNGGCMRPVEMIVPEATILNPRFPAPVASGNVETSQRVVDVLLGALGMAAASQGTMNNFLFQVEGDTPYYETIAGGAGAMDGCPGASGVQVHMTNTRMTDPEVLEYRHPQVMIRQFRFRKGSGGEGRFRGGDGVVREIRFLKAATASLISERRTSRPYGMAGGGEGARGENLLIRRDGKVEKLPGRATVQVREGESIVIKTPGGGGFGKKGNN